MLNINIICVGKLKEKYLKDALNEYIKRLSRYCKLTITELPDEKIPDKLNPNLEIDIKQITSEEFSKKIENLSMENSNITFIIGGSLGLTTELLNICDFKISFSKMTFPHQLIRVFLLEQIFRAFKIQKGETYHR